MNRVNSSSETLSLLQDLYSKVHSHDRNFVIQLVDSMPRYIQKLLISEYDKKQSRFEANSFLRTTVSDLVKLIPPILKNKFDATEDDLKALAKDG